MSQSPSQDAWATRKYVECASTDFLYNIPSQDAVSKKYVECASTSYLCNIQNDEVIDQPGCSEQKRLLWAKILAKNELIDKMGYIILD